MKGRDVIAAAFIGCTLFMSGVAVEFRAEPQLVRPGYDRVALRHVDDGRKQGRTKRKMRPTIDPRTDGEKDIDKLDARIRLLWAKVERLESKLLGTQQEEEKLSA